MHLPPTACGTECASACGIFAFLIALCARAGAKTPLTSLGKAFFIAVYCGEFIFLEY